MTVIQYVQYLLEQNWTKSRDGRVFDVPEPEIYTENEEQQVDYKRHDSAEIVDNGYMDTEPTDFAYAHERQTIRVGVDIRSKTRRIDGERIDGRRRTFGYRNTTPSTDQHGLQPGEAEPWGGLTGEVKKIINDHRKRHQEFDVILVTGISDTSGTTGVNSYRAKVDIEFRNFGVEL